MSLTVFLDFNRKHFVEWVVFKYVKNRECSSKRLQLITEEVITGELFW
jgi:hypothetical protein